MNERLKGDLYIELSIKSIDKFTSNFNSKLSSKYHSLIYVLDGIATIVIDGKETFADKFDLLYFNKRQKIEIQPGHYTILQILFDGTAVNELIFESSFNQFKIINVIEGSQLSYDLYRLGHIADNNSHPNLLALGLLFEVFYELTKDSLNTKEEKIYGKQYHIKQAKRFMNLNYQKNISINDIARSIGVSPNYLADLFRTLDKVSPKQYLTSLRMEKAKELLLTRRYKIKDVAKMVGYDNQLHFSSEFKKYSSFTPRDYVISTIQNYNKDKN